MKLLKALFAAIFACGLLYLAVYAVNMYQTDRMNQQIAEGVHVLREQTATAIPAAETPAATPTAVPPQTPTAAPVATPVAVSPEATESPAPDVPAAPTATATASPSPAPTTASTATPKAEDPLLIHYQSLAEQNADMIGWIHVEGTAIDYPVMYTPDDGEYYLHHGFDKAYAFEGVPFVDARCDPHQPSGNIIVYGHNMRGGSMFGPLQAYVKEEFFAENRYIAFDTLDRRGIYEIFAAIPVDLADMEDERMRCYGVSLTEDQAQVDTLYAYLEEYAVQLWPYAYPQVGDELLTLSTCTGFRYADRLVIMARRVGEALPETVIP